MGKPEVYLFGSHYLTGFLNERPLARLREDLADVLATEEGVHMAKAASETHQDVLDLVIHHVKMAVGRMIRSDILRPLVRYNWGEEAARRLTPKVVLSSTEKHNWAKDASAVSALASSQYMDPSQYREMDARLGLPRRKIGLDGRD